MRGTPRAVLAGENAEEIAAVEGAPLAQVVQRVLEVSDNEGAEVLLRQAALAAGRPGSFAGGSRRVHAVLDELGIDTGRDRIHDGSGLSRLNLIRPETLLGVISAAAGDDHPELRPVLTGLPVAGFTGSLGDRFVSGSPAGPGDVRAKTGTLTRSARARRHGGDARRRRRSASSSSPTGSPATPTASRRAPASRRPPPRSPPARAGAPRRVGVMVGRSTMIDWDLAVSAASRMAGAGPSITRDEADQVVGELRGGAEKSTPLVREFTQLAAGERTAPILVVDRPGWIRANADGFAEVMGPLVEKLQSRKGAPSPLAEAVGSRVTGLEVGALLGFMSSKVLGQFDPFFGLDQPGTTGPAGRLLLVAPNIVHAEREMGVDASDFRLWVCLHEETHRVQFTAVPWMRDHLRSEIEALVGQIEVDPAKMAAMVGEGVKRVGDILRGDDDVSLLDLFSSAGQREVLDRITAVMSLLEGHADVVMDGVGPEVIPTVGGHPPAVHRASQGRRIPRPGAAQAARSRRQDGAVPRRGCLRAWRARPGRHGGLQRGLGRAGQPAFSRRDRRPRSLGPARPRLSRAVSLDPAVAACRSAVRRTLADLEEAATVLVACSGGADSLALLAATVFEGSKVGHRVVGVTVDHGLQDGSREHAEDVVVQMAHARRRRDGRGARRGAGGRPGARGGGACGPLRRARGGRGADRRRRAARSHPRRPG